MRRPPRNSPARTSCFCTSCTNVPGSRSPWRGRRQWLRSGSSPRSRGRTGCPRCDRRALPAARHPGVIGAFAERALRLRGLPAGEADMPASARAVLLAGELQEVSRAAFLAHRMTGADPGSDPWLPPELKEAFDHAADGWPGGAAALVTAIAGAAPGTFALLAGPLAQHPDPAVAHAARRARLTAQAAVTAPHGRRPSPGPPGRARAAGGGIAEHSGRLPGRDAGSARTTGARTASAAHGNGRDL